MAHDVFAVPATGAGVERQFSKSGRIALSKSHWQTFDSWETWVRDEIYDDGDSKDRDEDPEESAKMIEWEKEWWQKADARLRILMRGTLIEELDFL